MTNGSLVLPRQQTRFRTGAFATGSLVLWLLLAPAASAQLISIRTVPMGSEQFEIFPSQNLGMGGVSIALPDTLLDPFRNPAKSTRLDSGRLYGSPVLYRVSQNAGAGRTLPIGAFAKLGSWYSGLALALQEVEPSGPSFSPPILLTDTRGGAPQVVPQVPASTRSHGNAFAFASMGRTLPGTGLSLAGSVRWRKLNAVDGVDMLYARSQSIQQFGHVLDARLGLLKEWAGGPSFEALVLHNRFKMTHDVTYQDLFWDPATQRTSTVPRLEENLDETLAWGLHVAYQRPLRQSGWRWGWLATANRMSHPQMPNYEVVNVGISPIPWDPGHSHAYNLGVGISRVTGPVRFGIDAIYEPIWSYTWGEAATPIATRTGGTIPIGGKTIENHFRFSNALVRMGISQEQSLGTAAVGFQFGVMARSLHYWLGQFDNVSVAGRDQEEQWTEWTPTWGAVLRFPELEIRYQGRMTTGTGRPGVFGGGGPVPLAVDAAANILTAPSGPLTMGDVRVFAHQVTVSLPLVLGGARGGAR